MVDDFSARDADERGADTALQQGEVSWPTAPRNTQPARTSRPTHTVIIPVYRQWQTLQLCLDSLAAQEGVSPTDYEIIVVNNEPGAAPANLALPANARMIDEAAKGSYAARNAGIAAARGDFLCFTDADCIPAPEWLAEISAAFAAHPEAGLIGGDIRLFTRARDANPAELYELMFILGQERWVRKDGWAATANLAVRRSVLEVVGPFDATLLSRGDQVWGRLAAAQGHEIVFSEQAYVHHPARADMRELAIKSRRGAGGYVASRLERNSRALLALKLCLRLPLRLLPPVKYLPRILRHEKGSTGGKLGAFGVFYAMRVIRAWEETRLALLGGEPERR